MKTKEILISAVKEWRIWGTMSSVTLMVIGLAIGWLNVTGASIFTLGPTLGVIVLLFLEE